MASEAHRDRLPFEPSKKRQKPAKTKPTSTGDVKPEKTPVSKNTKQSEAVKPVLKKTKPETVKRLTKEEMAIPQVVSTRMARRMAVFCGIPTFLGVATFVICYVVVSQGLVKLPNVAVLLASMGFFGLGVIGLSYGVLSASWDEEIVGSTLGWQEFKVNLGRMASTWRETRQKKV